MYAESRCFIRRKIFSFKCWPSGICQSHRTVFIWCFTTDQETQNFQTPTSPTSIESLYCDLETKEWSLLLPLHILLSWEIYVYVAEEKPIKGLINTHGSFELLPSNGPIWCVLHSAALTKLAAKDRHLVDDPSLKVYIWPAAFVIDLMTWSLQYPRQAAALAPTHKSPCRAAINIIPPLGHEKVSDV